MSHSNKTVYPNDLTPNKISFDIVGTEGIEKLEFNEVDSSVIVPGFQSEEMILHYRLFNDDSLEFKIDNQLLNAYKTRFLDIKYEDTLFASISTRSEQLENLKDSLNTVRDSIILNRGSYSEQYQLTKKIYTGTFKITKSSKNDQLILKSSETEIQLVSEKYLTEQRINELFQRVINYSQHYV
ncbi:hypothetical protein [Fulvivirga ligni]|uniref:hypothetical protein n=1 Tax=Fulvivirga ligni TaxID=2904246 RepID=UPI001F2C0F3A|nr:hypothetical protein [Fulvivirga ligni]UII20262.1 hypothetical protein LVD16_20675 [Fulvivirga ligni]